MKFDGERQIERSACEANWLFRSPVGEEVYCYDTHSNEREAGCGDRGNMSH
jgi:hypothetical protein